MKINARAVISGVILLSIFSNVLGQQWQYQVKPGDTLWSISEEYLINQSYVNRLQQFNAISDPEVLQPGTTISAPVEWLGNLPGSASIVSMTGDLAVIRDNQRLRVDPGFKLMADDKIITGDYSVAVLEFSDRSTVRVYPETELTFTTFKQSYDGGVVKARMSVKSGRIRVQSNPQEERGHRLDIESPAAISTIRGTDFRVGVESHTGDTVTEVLSGSVAVTAQQKEVALPNLYGTKTETGQAPIKPVKLIKAPDLIFETAIETNVGEISWGRLARAESYRVRVASDQAFTEIIYDQRMAATRASDVFFPHDGDFYTSVRAIDSNGIEGLDATAKISVNARPEAPLIIGPKNDSSIFDVSPLFSWSVPSDASTQVQFQMSENVQFDPLLIDQVLEPTDSYIPQTELLPGEYYWRVANLDGQGRGPYSAASRLLITDQPEIAAELDDSGTQISLSLSQDHSVSRYHVQVSRDDSFDEIFYEAWLDSEEFSFDSQGSGRYYIRVGIESTADGNDIVYGHPQMVLVPFDDWKQLITTIVAGLLIIF